MKAGGSWGGWKHSIYIRKVSSYAQNFYLLKIHFNLFEIPNQLLKFEKFYPVWKFISNMNPEKLYHVCVFEFIIW